MSAHCQCSQWVCMYGVALPGERHHRECSKWNRQLEAFITRTELIVCGDPGDDESHNCDAMGCTTVSHVLYRAPIPQELAQQEKPHG